MRAFKIVLITLASILVVILLFGWYMGFFNKVKVVETKAGGYNVVGMEVTGPYAESGKYMMDVDKKLRDKGIASSKGFGIYYDDPKVVSEDKCRSFVGNVLEEKDLNRIPDLQSAGFRVDSIPVAQTLVVEFPLKNSFSYMVGPMKVYPLLGKYMEEKGYETTLAIELYDPANKKILYMMQYK